MTDSTTGTNFVSPGEVKVIKNALNVGTFEDLGVAMFEVCYETLNC